MSGPSLSPTSSSSDEDEDSFDRRWYDRGNRRAPDLQPVPDKLAAIEALRADVADWQSPKERERFLHRLDPLVRNWERGIPDLREILRPEEIELLLQESLNHIEAHRDDVGNRFVSFVCRAGYRSEPELDEATGEPILRRTTALHLAAQTALNYRELHSNWNDDACLKVLHDLYRIYDGANYVDEEYGYSHFHMFCQLACFFRHCVEKFLKLGRADPNQLAEKTGDTPLHMVQFMDEATVRLLLRHGADPNLANKQGRTPLHATSPSRRALQAMFRIAGASGRPVLIDARDNCGRTPLRLAAEQLDLDKVELLLDYGADVDLVDPLVWAVPKRRAIGTLPGSAESNAGHVALFNFELAAGALAVIECLEKRGGYELDRWGAARIMKAFARNGLFLTERQAMERSWYEDERFVEEAKKLMILPRASSHPQVTTEVEYIAIGGVGGEGGGRRGGRGGRRGRGGRSKPSREEESSKVATRLSVYDLIAMRPEEAAKTVTYRDYYELARSHDSRWFGHEPRNPFEICDGRPCEKLAKVFSHLSEKLARGFFRRWALPPFLELTRNALPILCCEKILGLLMNQDLHNVCLAAGGQD